MSRILDKAFRYTPSHETNVAKTIKREQDRLKAIRKEADANAKEAAQKVEQMKPRLKARTA